MKRKGRNGNGVAMEYRALGEAYHDACYAIFLEELEKILRRNPKARTRLDHALLEFRRAVFEEMFSN